MKATEPITLNVDFDYNFEVIEIQSGGTMRILTDLEAELHIEGHPSSNSVVTTEGRNLLQRVRDKLR